MDKKLPKPELPKPFRKLSLRVSKSHLPDNAGYKGDVVRQRTLSTDDIAARVVGKRSEYCKKTLITTFNLLKRGIYNAVEKDYNVDFDFGQTKLTMNGPFESLYEKLNPNRHTLAPRLRPAPELKQWVANLRAVNETYQLNYSSQPHPAYISLHIQPRTSSNGEPYSQLPASEHHFIFIYGDRLELMGDDLHVDLYLHRPDGSGEYFYLPSEVFINTGRRLCFTPGFAFADGEWVAEVVAQYTPDSRPYKQPRYGTLTFLVRQLPNLPCSYHA